MRLFQYSILIWHMLTNFRPIYEAKSDFLLFRLFIHLLAKEWIFCSLKITSCVNSKLSTIYLMNSGAFCPS